jgi:hypothetical protein
MPDLARQRFDALVGAHACALVQGHIDLGDHGIGFGARLPQRLADLERDAERDPSRWARSSSW